MYKYKYKKITGVRIYVLLSKHEKIKYFRYAVNVRSSFEEKKIGAIRRQKRQTAERHA